MRAILSYDEITYDETYRYNTIGTGEHQIFRVGQWSDDNYLVLLYRDGYVTDVSVDQFKRHIAERRIYTYRE
jgi:hypothetical protein